MLIDPRTWLRLPLPTLALGLLALSMVVGIVIVLVRGTQAERLLATPATKLAPFVFQGDAVPHSMDLAAIQMQPLFHSTRAFYVKPVEAAPTAPPRPDYRLAGAIILPGKTPVAVVVNRASSVSKRVKPGDELDGWQVQSVDRRQVVLTWGNERAEITSSGLPQGGSATLRSGGAQAAMVNSGGGLKRVPIVRQQVTAAGGIQSLGASGTSSAGVGTGGPYNDSPRLYRPPPK